MKLKVLIPMLFAGLIPAAHLHAQNKDLVAVVDGNSQLALDLYRQISKEPGNTFFSPYSISTVLGMTFAGAKGKTAQEMAQALHFTLDQERLHPAFGELIGKIQGTEKKRAFQLTMANGLWCDQSKLQLNANFLRIAQRDYQSEFRLVDFVGDAERSREMINDWVGVKTHEKIQQLLPPGSIRSNTRLVLVNAIYFKAAWLHQFTKDKTKPEEFTVSGGAEIKVPTMQNTFSVKLMGNDDFQLAELPYQDNEVSMVILLPKKKNGLTAIEVKLTPKILQEALSQTKRTNTKLSLPKFKMTTKFDLNDKLQTLGMKDAFVPGIANFTGMQNGDIQVESLSISKVVHKAFVDVNEEGTEAAAATAVTMIGTTSAPPPPVPFKCDHPFLFMLRHNDSGSILFMGRVDDPR